MFGGSHISSAENKIHFGSRMGRVIRTYPGAVLVRCARMFAPWSIGLVINRGLRDYMMAKVIGDEEDI